MVTMTQETTREDLIRASIDEHRQAARRDMRQATMMNGVSRLSKTPAEIRAKIEECNEKIEEELRERWAYLLEDHTAYETKKMLKGIDNVISSYQMIKMALEWTLGSEPEMQL